MRETLDIVIIEYLILNHFIIDSQIGCYKRTWNIQEEA